MFIIDKFKYEYIGLFVENLGIEVDNIPVCRDGDLRSKF